MAAKVFDVIVIGGGMVGAALAARLSQSGMSVALIEARQQQPFDNEQDYDLRVSAISAASCGLLQDAGAWAAIERQRHCSYSHMRIWESDTGSELQFSASEAGRESLGYIIENKLILDALWQQLDRVTLYCPDTVSALSLHADAARVTLDSGLELEAALLVGADGANSRSREMVGITTFGRAYQQKGIVAVVSTEQAHAQTAWQRFMSTGPLAFLPLDDGRCSIVWSARDELAAELMALNDAEFCKQLQEASQGRLGTVLGTGPRAAFPLQMRQAEQYVKPRFALVGDAAHVVHPLAGQGVNLGFGDVIHLVELLIEASGRGRDPGGIKLLRRYERARKSEDILMMQLTDGLSRLYASDLKLVATGRREGVKLVNVLKPLKTAFIRHAVGQ